MITIEKIFTDNKKWKKNMQTHKVNGNIEWRNNLAVTMLLITAECRKKKLRNKNK